MSDNLINPNTLENFVANPGYSGGNVYDKTKSFSALNKGDKNLHNSIYSNLVPGVNDMIVKQNKKFENVNKINPYFYNEKPGGPGQCLNECKKLKQAVAYTYDKIDGDCELYNTVPNKLVDDNSKISGYSVKYDFNMDKLNGDQVTNIQNRIGSMYLQQKFDIINKDNKNITKCIRTIPGNTNINMELEISTGNGKWASSDKIVEVYLHQEGQGRVSNILNFDGTSFKRGELTSVDANFSLTSEKFNGLAITVANDGIGISSIKLGTDIGGNDYNIFTEYYGSRVWIKNETYWIKMKQMNINNLEFNTSLFKRFNGNNLSNNTLKYEPSKTKELDNILKESNWSISVDYTVKNNNNSWRNIFSYGNSNNVRVPALWIFPNKPWLMHFRIRTNRNNNDGFDFWIPRQFRKYGQNIHLEFEFFQYKNEYNNQKGFIVVVSVNGIYSSMRNFTNTIFNKEPNQNFYIKNPWYKNRDTYGVNNVQFNYRKMKLLTTGRGWGGRYENRNRFNQLINNLPIPWYIVRVGYSGYYAEYNIMVYKRLTQSKGVDVWSLFHENWFDNSRGVRNAFNSDFELYNTLQDAISGVGRWRSCNFNDPGIGFPRDCGVNGLRPWQWQSKRKGNKTTWKIYVYDSRSSFLNTNLKDPFYGTVKGYEADPKCAYENIPKPNNIFQRNITPLNKKNDPYKLLNGADIDSNIFNFNKDMKNVNDFKNELGNLNSDNPELTMMYDENTRKIANIKESKAASINIKGLKEAVGGKFENFENKCNSNSKYLVYIIIIIVLLILFYFFSK